jgi:sigma-B regulation protein RsbU (phosphoserine phosphatase)
LISGAEISTIRTHGLPLGMFCNEQFSVEKIKLKPGDTLLLYTDGLAEAEDGDGNPYGTDRLCELAKRSRTLAPELLVGACLHDLKSFTRARNDDLTVMALQWMPPEYTLATEGRPATVTRKTVN